VLEGGSLTVREEFVEPKTIQAHRSLRAYFHYFFVLFIGNDGIGRCNRNEQRSDRH
jgi:hypothetical protein